MENISALHFPMDSIGATPRHIVGIMHPEHFMELAEIAPLQKAVAVELMATKDGKKMRVSGSIRAEVMQVCGWCLKSFATFIDEEVDRIYNSGEDPASKLIDYEIEDDEVYLSDGVFSLLRMVEEEIILALDMAPVCDRQCRGLCSQCGASRNENPCSCSEEEKESPFAILKTIMAENKR